MKQYFLLSIQQYFFRYRVVYATLNYKYVTVVMVTA